MLTTVTSRRSAIEEPHAIVNLKVGKKAVLGPFVSLANRMPSIIDDVHNKPAALSEFEQCYGTCRSPEELVRKLGLVKHPAVQPCLGVASVEPWRKLSASSNILYRTDLQGMFGDFTCARAGHTTKAEREARVAAKGASSQGAAVIL